jgi:hypothetical protein
MSLDPYGDFVKLNYSMVSKANPKFQLAEIMNHVNSRWNVYKNAVKKTKSKKLKKVPKKFNPKRVSLYTIFLIEKLPIVKKEFPNETANTFCRIGRMWYDLKNSKKQEDVAYLKTLGPKREKYIQSRILKLTGSAQKDGDMGSVDRVEPHIISADKLIEHHAHSIVQPDIPLKVKKAKSNDKYHSDVLTHLDDVPVNSKSVPDKLKIGDYVSRISYCQVIDIEQTKVLIQNEGGYEWSISKHVIEKEIYAASHYATTQKYTQNQLAELMMNTREAAFTVCFEKKLNKDHIKTILDENNGIETKQLSTMILEGVKRVLVGRLIDVEEKLGRSKVYDLEASGIRFVDHRTIKWIVYKNVKYELK